MNAPPLSKITYQQALYRYILFVLVVPAILFGLFLLVMNYRSSQVLAEQRTTNQAEVFARELAIQLQNIRLVAAGYHTDEPMAAIANRQPLARFATTRLQELVASSPFIELAVVVDTNGEVLAGYPALALGLRSDTMTSATLSAVNDKSMSDTGQFFMVDDLELIVAGKADRKVRAGYDGIYIAVPLAVRTRSLANPLRVTSVMWAKIDADAMLSAMPLPEWVLEQQLTMMLGDHLIAEKLPLHPIDNPLTAASELSIPVTTLNATQKLSAALTLSQDQLTLSAWQLLIFGTFAMLVGGLALSLSMRKMASALSRPVRVLVQYSRDIGRNQFDAPAVRFKFQEFDDLRESMVTMAMRLKHSMKKQEQMANTDGLSGLANRRHFDEVGPLQFIDNRNNKNSDKSLWLVILDADHFKRINDIAGHATGDLVIKNIANCIRETARESDLAARVGGEEFALLMRDCNLEAVARITESIRVAVEALAIPGWTDVHGAVTISVGCASATGKANFGDLYKAADKALYAAKGKGRNQVFIEKQSSSPPATLVTPP